jgi:hypothetical protein
LVGGDGVTFVEQGSPGFSLRRQCELRCWGRAYEIGLLRSLRPSVAMTFAGGSDGGEDGTLCLVQGWR